MTISSLLIESEKILKNAFIGTARLDCEVLIADELDKDRSWINAHEDFELTDESVLRLRKRIKRRSENEPLAYIRGFQEFYGRNFLVNSDVLVPRPESENMIELLLDQVESIKLDVEELQIIDIGTGSGNLIIATALEMPKVKNQKSKVGYIGLDISEDALKVARRNAKNLKAEVDFMHFNLLNDSLSQVSNTKYQILLANLPYVPNDYAVNEATKHEPEIALFSGKDGLDHYRKLFEQLRTANTGTTVVITESLIEQHKELTKIAKNAGFLEVDKKDLIQVFTQPSAS